MRPFTYATLLMLSLATAGQADLITNGNFAIVTPSLQNNGICTTDTAIFPYGSCTAANWTGTYQVGNGSTIGISGSSFTIPQPDPGGSGNALILQTYFNQVSSFASQTVDVTDPGTYTLSFNLANRTSTGLTDGPQTVSVLLNGNVISGGVFSKLSGAWTLETLNLNLGVGNQTISFQGLATSPTDVSAFVDDVSLLPQTSAGQAPEPGGLALFGVGIGLVAVAKKRIAGPGTTHHRNHE